MKAAPSLPIVAAVAVLLTGVGACDDNPFDVVWTANPDTVLLYSLARPELNLPSAFDFVPSRRRSVRIEEPGASGNWDVAVDTGENGMLLFVPPQALGVDARAGLARLPGISFDEAVEAPADSAAYSFEDPLPVEVGELYAVRTRRARGGFGRSCIFFGKLVPIETDDEAETVRFMYDMNPDCNDTGLVPDQFPEDGEDDGEDGESS